MADSSGSESIIVLAVGFLPASQLPRVARVRRNAALAPYGLAVQPQQPYGVDGEEDAALGSRSTHPARLLDERSLLTRVMLRRSSPA